MMLKTRRRAHVVAAKCPNCEAPLPVTVSKRVTMRVAICEGCGTEYLYSAWDMVARDNMLFTKVELQQMGATGVHRKETP